MRGGFLRRVRHRHTAAGTVLAVTASVLVVIAVADSPARMPVGHSPGQPVWGSAAGRPSRVPTTATMAQLVDGKVSAAGTPVAPALGRAPGAVPQAAPPSPLTLPVSGSRDDALRVLPAPPGDTKTGYDPATSHELTGERGADRQVYANADGTQTMKVYQAPVNWRRPDGSWVPIDPTLVPAGNPTPSSGPAPSAASAPATGSAPATTGPATQPSAAATGPAPGWTVRSAPQPEAFGGYADAVTLVRLPLDGSHGVGFALGGAAHVAGRISGNQVTYPGARPDADVVFAAGAGSVKESLVLRSADAPTSWVFPLRLDGLHAVATPDGSVAFADSAGTVRAVVPAGFMTDSAMDPRTGDGARSDGVRYSLATVSGSPAIRVDLDAAWLRDPRRVFPVTVDPSVESVKSGATTYVMSGESADHSDESEIKVGTYDSGGHVAKSFLKFDSVSSALRNNNVLGARLGLFNSWSYSCQARPVEVYPVTESWTASGTRSWPGPSTGKAIASKSFASGWKSDPYGSSPCPSKWEGIDLGQGGNDLINGWTHGTKANNGLALGASSGSSYGWKRFTSDNNPTGDPFLSLTYTRYGATYALVSPQPVKQVWPNQDGSIRLKLTNTGADTWTATNGFELSYRVYDTHGKLVADHPVFTPMPASVPPGGSVYVNANVKALPVGDFALNFDMYASANTSSPVSFTSQGVAPYAVGLHVPDPPPVVAGVYPPTGFLSPTVTPQLSTSASSPIGKALTYNFSLTCHPLPGITCPASIITSGPLPVPYWTVTQAMTWNQPYSWTVTASDGTTSTTVGPVSITPAVPQPELSSHLADPSGRPADPQTGDYTTGAVDAAVAVAGPPLRIARDYHSLDPRTDGAFGAGWSTTTDMRVSPDDDGSGNVVVTTADGTEQRFANNGTATFAPPMGSPDVLVHDSDGGWSLRDASGYRYDFAATGGLRRIADRNGLAQTYTVDGSGHLATITDAASGRALHLSWIVPDGTTVAHVATVTTDAPSAGQPGLSWSYTYDGDRLTKVCLPTGGCTSYDYAATGSHYRSAVLNDGPRAYYRLGDDPAATAATSQTDVNLGTDSGTYTNVTLGAPGPLAGPAQSAATFNGYSSSVTLADNLVSDSTYVTVDLWFKAAGGGGVLYGYQADPLTANSTTGNADRHNPALYVGGDGKLRGEFWNGSVDPITTPDSVADGDWHHVVLSAAGTTQSLYLDGGLVGTLAGRIDQGSMTHNVVGAGFWLNWPSAITATSPVISTDPAGHFKGSIAEVAVYPHPLGQPAISAHDALADRGSAELTGITLPSGRAGGQVSYDAGHDRASAYTDSDGGQWQIQLPLTTGYRSSPETLGEATRHVTVVDPAGRDEVYGYDAVHAGRLVSYDRGAGHTRTFGYDAAGFLDQVTDEDGNVVSLANDAHGNVVSRSWYPTQPASGTGCCTTYYSYAYNDADPLDPRNNTLTGVRDARSSSAADTTYLTSYSYNPAGQLATSTTPATSDFPSGRTTSYTYSTAGTPADGGGTTPAGLLLSTTTPDGATTGYAYSSAGDLVQLTEPSGRRLRYGYDLLGRPTSQVDYTDAFPDGLTTGYTYNPVNQPLSVTYPGVHNQITGVTHTRAERYTYDPDGNLTDATQADTTGGDPSRTTTYTYDDNGNPASITDPTGATTGYTYDGSGNLVEMVDADGNTFAYQYNEYGETTSVTLRAGGTDPGDPGGGTDTPLESDAYDPAGLLASRTTAMGRITNYFYDHNEDLIAAQQQPPTGPGRQTAYTYDSAGNLVATATSDLPVKTSTVTNYTVDAAGRTTRVVFDPPPAGHTTAGYVDRTTAFTYDAADRVTSRTLSDPSGASRGDYAYNAAGAMVAATIHDASVDLTTTWSVDQRGLATSITDARGNAAEATAADYTTDFGYDEAGSLTTVTGAPVDAQAYGGNATTVRPLTRSGYDAFGDRTQSTDAAGHIATTDYDQAGRPVATTTPAYTPPGGGATITATTREAYDGLGQPSAITDPLGNITTYTYDALGDLTGRTDPQLTGRSAPGGWSYGYDGDGEQTSSTDPTGAITQTTYDYFGDVATTTQALRSDTGIQYHTTTYGYDYQGEATTVTSPTGVASTLAYDHAGELTSATDAYGNTTGYGYDYAGRQVRVTHPDNTSTTDGYDQAGNLTSTTDWTAPSGGTTAPLRTATIGYDAVGNPTSATTARGVTTTFQYDAGNRLVRQIEPVSPDSSITTSYGYDADGNQTSVTDGRGNTTWTTYNTWNLPESVIEPATAATPTDRTYTTVYDADGQTAAQTSPGGVAITTSHDQLGDVTRRSGTGAQAVTADQTFGYDLAGRLTSASAPGGTDEFTYDDAGNLTATAGPSGTASFGYDADNRLTSRTDTAGTTSYGYDRAGRLATLSDPLTGSTASYRYNADGLVSSVGYASATGTGPTRGYTYDPLRRPSGDALAAAGGAPISSTTYGYDADDNLTTKTTSGYAGSGSTSYGYDQADRLASATTGENTTGYGYDASGNLTTAGATTYTYDARDQLTSSTTDGATTSYGWTARGTRASVTPPGGGAQSSTADAFGQTVTAPGGVGYAYDALGRQVTRSVGADTQTFAYSGIDDTLASDDDQSYAYDPDGDLASVDAGGGGLAALTDVHDNVSGTFATAPATGALAGSTAYDPYGNKTASTGAQTDLGYQSDWTDPATGQVDMAARRYDPGTGAFTSRDTWNNNPVPDSINANRYSYANGQPLTSTDPTGHGSVCIGYGTRGGSHHNIICFGFGLPWDVGGGSFPPFSSGGSHSGGGSASSSGSTTGYYGGGGGRCSWACYAPPVFLPPPPPPPPLDVYGGPHPKRAPAPPSWLTHGKYFVKLAKDVTQVGALLAGGLGLLRGAVIEVADLFTDPPTATDPDTPNNDIQGPPDDGTPPDQPAPRYGNQPKPEPDTPEPNSPEPGQGGEGAGNGGEQPPSPPSADEPPNGPDEPNEPGPGKPRFTVDSQGTAVDTTTQPWLDSWLNYGRQQVLDDLIEPAGVESTGPGTELEPIGDAGGDLVGRTPVDSAGSDTSSYDITRFKYDRTGLPSPIPPNLSGWRLWLYLFLTVIQHVFKGAAPP
ncbi:polymorphic toxin-type HINT domain-containing protein [Rugosimonospora acidiphila]|uniref:Polymorphic toxin-type HINT domain-containing protein n=1 Tax=Rugosimonospora acidiphila TaxID=556531 RepID=A0ABP9RKY4_9ACTN